MRGRKREVESGKGKDTEEGLKWLKIPKRVGMNGKKCQEPRKGKENRKKAKNQKRIRLIKKRRKGGTKRQGE